MRGWFRLAASSPRRLASSNRQCFGKSRISGVLCAVLFSGLLLPGICAAADPAFSSTAPYGAQRGTEITVTFGGQRLADAQQVLLYEPGIEVLELTPGDAASFTAKLKISDDCRIGQHGLRLRTASGVSNLRTFSIGALPEVSEVEPNNDFETAHKIELGTTINGVAENEDVDYFLVEAKQGERITAEIEGIRLGNTFFDPAVAILDMERFELASSDDTALVYQDAVASVLAPEDGTYVIQVRESSYGGNGACYYRLHVGKFPRPRGTVPAGGRPGETLELTWIGDLAGPWTETVTLPEKPGNYELIAHDEHGIAPSANTLRVVDIPNVLEVEPNNGHAEATPLTVPAALNGVIGEDGDVDCFKFTATKGQVLDVQVYARQLRSPLDPVIGVAHLGGAGVAGNDDNAGQPDSYVRFTAPEDGEYVLTLHDHLRKGGPNYFYRVEVTPVTPQLVMGLPERRQFVDITASVPQGNRTALLVSATRNNFGGDLNVLFEGLPDGVTVETLPMAADQTTIPVLLTATAEAPLAGALVNVVGRHADESTGIVGQLEQRTSMVRGQNNIHVWRHLTERLALAVTEQAPFSLEIIQPQAPLVRGGEMQLKVVATRHEDFNGPINIQLLYDPSGVGSQKSVQIAEGASEATIQLNANSNAPAKTWKIIVTGEADAGNGSLLVSSQMAELEVAEQFFNITFDAAAVEQGQQTALLIHVENLREFEGAAKIELLGLPNEVTAPVVEVTPETTETTFAITTTANSPAGKHKTLVARGIVTVNGEPVTHMIGGGELRIDTPLPPKANDPMPVAQAAPPAAAAPTEKPLSRLQQLRLERQQAKEARAAASEETTETAEEATESPDEAPPAEETPAEPAAQE